MSLLKNALTLIVLAALACTAGAEKKIELQDIEEDNLKSEKQKDSQDNETYKQQIPLTGPARDSLPLEFLKSGLLRFFEAPITALQQPRFANQYAVTETPTAIDAAQKSEITGPSGPAQQPMVGYLSNVPMQILLVPQYYNNEQGEQTANSQPGIQYVTPIASVNLSQYPSGGDADQQQHFVEVPQYVAPTSNGNSYSGGYNPYKPQYFVTYGPPATMAPASSRATTAMIPPVAAPTSLIPSSHIPQGYIQHQSPLVAPPAYPKTYYPTYAHYTDTNSVDDTQDYRESKKLYISQTEYPVAKSVQPENPRYYTSRTPIKGDRGHPNAISELPAPPPIIYEPAPQAAGVPKVLPMYRPFTKPVYSHISGNLIQATPNRQENYSKRRPTSLIDSYIPSALQIEYMRRGLGRDPISTYEALANRFVGGPVTPRHYETGFLPNQMYHTAAGGVTFGHYKRNPKIDKNVHK